MALKDLQNSLDETLKFAITEEAKLPLDEIIMTLMVCRTFNDRWKGHGGAMSSLHREVKLKLYTDEQFKMSENI